MFNTGHIIFHLYSVKMVLILCQVNSLVKPHLLGHETKLFGRQVLEFKDEPPVKVAISVQRPVVDISFLLVLLHAWHPAGKWEQEV